MVVGEAIENEEHGRLSGSNKAPQNIKLYCLCPSAYPSHQHDNPARGMHNRLGVTPL